MAACIAYNFNMEQIQTIITAVCQPKSPVIGSFLGASM